MHNKRITFSLLYSKGYFYLSRNFRLQKVGDIDWLEKNYSFNETCQYIDELVFILVTKNPETIEINNFFKSIDKIRKKIFAPIMIGGAIRNLNNVKNCFENGADKIIINTESKNSKLLDEISEIYGSQATSIMIDYKYDENKNKYQVFTNCGTKKVEKDLFHTLKKLSEYNFGEFILHSINHDGTGNGYDLDMLKSISFKINKPVLLMGGVGKPDHIISALKNDMISGVITANLFNFIGDGLKLTRELAIQKGIEVAKLI